LVHLLYYCIVFGLYLVTISYLIARTLQRLREKIAKMNEEDNHNNPLQENAEEEETQQQQDEVMIHHDKSPFHNRETFESVDFYSTLHFDSDEEHELRLLDNEDGYNIEPSNNRVSSHRVQSPNQSQHLSILLEIPIDAFNYVRNALYVYLLRPFFKFTRASQVKAVVFLTVLGIGASLHNLFVDACVGYLEDAHVRFAQLTRFYVFNYLFYCTYAVLFGLLSASCVHLISKYSAGKIF
jgi:hypothetical protein